MRLTERARHYVMKHAASSREEQAVIAATSYSRKSPSPDAIACVVAGTRSDSSRIIDLMLNRVDLEPGWQPVLKVLLLVHRCLQDGSMHFLSELDLDPSLLRLAGFEDNSNGESVHMSKHVRRYSEYLEGVVMVHGELRRIAPILNLHVAARRDTRTEGLGDLASAPGALLRLIACLHMHLCRLLHCERCGRPRDLPGEEDCPVALSILVLLLRDGLHVYRLLSEAVMQLLSDVTRLSAEHSVRALDAYRHFVEVTHEFNSMCGNMRRLRARGLLHTTDIPTLKPVDHERVLRALSAHCARVDPDGEISRRIARDAKKQGVNERRMTEEVDELDQLHQLRTWSQRQFGGPPGPAAQHADPVEGGVLLVDLSDASTDRQGERGTARSRERGDWDGRSGATEPGHAERAGTTAADPTIGDLIQL